MQNLITLGETVDYQLYGEQPEESGSSWRSAFQGHPRLLKLQGSIG